MQDLTSAQIEHVKFRVDKYDGDPPKPGEDKKPVETVELEYRNGELISERIIKQGVSDGTNDRRTELSSPSTD